jgi:hypothetical protein
MVYRRFDLPAFHRFAGKSDSQGVHCRAVLYLWKVPQLAAVRSAAGPGMLGKRHGLVSERPCLVVFSATKTGLRPGFFPDLQSCSLLRSSPRCRVGRWVRNGRLGPPPEAARSVLDAPDEPAGCGSLISRTSSLPVVAANRAFLRCWLSSSSYQQLRHQTPVVVVRRPQARRYH